MKNAMSGRETISTDAASYAVGDPVTVLFTHMPGNLFDRIAIAPSGSPPTVITQVDFTQGSVDGRVVFFGLAPDTYVARAILDRSSRVLAESAPFTIE